MGQQYIIYIYIYIYLKNAYNLVMREGLCYILLECDIAIETMYIN
jgi:hypothetical protein